MQETAAFTKEDWREVSKWISSLEVPKGFALCAFYDDLLKDRRVKAALKQALGPRTKKVVEELLWEGWADDSNEAEEVIERVVREGSTEAEVGERFMSGGEEPCVGYFRELVDAQCIATDILSNDRRFAEKVGATGFV